MMPTDSGSAAAEAARPTPIATERWWLVVMLARADRADRAALYRALGLSLRYEKQAPTGQERVHVRLELCRGGGRI